jgi:Predicted glycosyltransferases
MDVSVIIPTYNYGRFISEALKSVLEQTRPVSEIIVVDDGSTDDTKRAVRKISDKIKYIKQTNSGVCSARNRGVTESKGGFIAFLDADDIWEPTKLEKQLRKFAENPEVGLVHCGMREFDSETNKTISTRTDGEQGSVWRELLLWEVPCVNVSGSVIMVSRKAFENVGGFDTRLRVGEDWDFCYRIAKKYQVGFVREALVNYRSHGAAAHLNVKNMELGMKLFYEKAFSTDDANVLALRRRALGNFYRILAGSYFQAGNYSSFLSNLVKSIWMKPGNIDYFANKLLKKATN